MGARRVRIASLPPEASDVVLRNVLSRYGDVRNIQAETWSRLYRYPVANGIRLAKMTLSTHIPSRITVARHRVLASYDEQPMTYYGYNDTDLLY